MTHLTIEGQPAQILFEHTHRERLTDKGTEIVDVTIATLMTDSFHSTGLAIRNPAEPFNKWEGREYALERAIHANLLTFDEEVAVWTAFFDAIDGERKREEALRQLAEVNRLLEENDKLLVDAMKIKFELELNGDDLLDKQDELRWALK